MKSYFIKSGVETSDYPNHSMVEIAFVGRSNVGKSSLLNAILNKDLARVSATPGKTQLINFFSKEDKYCLVDLPGFGYAKRSTQEHKSWQSMIEAYLSTRENLKAVLLLVDSRRDIDAMEEDLIEFLNYHQIPFILVITKADKFKKSEMPEVLKKFSQYNIQKFFVSSEKGTGILELEKYIFNTWIKNNKLVKG